MNIRKISRMNGGKILTTETDGKEKDFTPVSKGNLENMYSPENQETLKKR